MSDTTANGNNIWKYIAISAVSALGGLLTGQFIPNRSIVTTTELSANFSPVNQQLAAQSLQISDLKDAVAELKGEIHAQQEFERKEALRSK